MKQALHFLCINQMPNYIYIIFWKQQNTVNLFTNGGKWIFNLLSNGGTWIFNLLTNGGTWTVDLLANGEEEVYGSKKVIPFSIMSELETQI